MRSSSFEFGEVINSKLRLIKINQSYKLAKFRENSIRWH